MPQKIVETYKNTRDLEGLSHKSYLLLKNGHQNNLKNIDLAIPHGKLVVVTGVSGSGKSSLAFETLYEEGRRRYVESLSAYIRQFLGKIRKPLIDYIKGLPPAIAIEQKRSTSNSRSTVGTVTEMFHYLKLLYARLGKTYSPVSGKEVKRQRVDDIVDFLVKQKKDSQIRILAELKLKEDRLWPEELGILLQKGFSRIVISSEDYDIEDILSSLEEKTIKPDLLDALESNAFILIDRLILDISDKDINLRVSDSVQTALHEGHGRCLVQLNGSEKYSFSNQFEADGIIFEEPTPDLFSYNSPYGACDECGGFGEILGIDENKVILNKQLSLYDGAVICWEGEKMSKWKKDFIRSADKVNFPIFKPYQELTEKEKDLLWDGFDETEGIYDFFNYLESNTYKVHYRIFLSRFKGRTRCKSCKGTRLRKEATYVKIGGKHIGELLQLPVSDLKEFFDQFSKENLKNPIAERLLHEINLRLNMMVNVGLGYLSLNRTSRSLSGGETQRIQLIYSLGSNLTGSLYILDEPSIGLHPKDTAQLIQVLIGLRDLGNTVVVVEHDEDIIRAADEIIDLGPHAGRFGGNIIFQGNHEKIKKEGSGITAQYLNGELKIPIRKKITDFEHFIEITGASQYNLKNIDVKIPLQAISVVTGVSGSGKTTLVKEVLFESLKNIGESLKPDAVNCKEISGRFDKIRNIEFVSQDSIDRSRRSNAITYLKIFDHIRELMSSQQLSKINGYTPAYFSFNVDGGRCEECKGDGKIVVEMQFVADMNLICEECKGKRYKDDILDVMYNGKNISDILNMTISEGMEFFADQKAIISGLEPLVQVGLDYLQLGQPTSTLSGGEAQRLKLASFLAKGLKKADPSLFIFDEPTTGLHWHDINKLLNSFNALLDIGHTILIIEHNLEIIKNADYLIDLGKEGGEEGGYLVYQGPPEKLIGNKDSYTAKYLKSKLN